jgi:hypothetical protein
VTKRGFSRAVAAVSITVAALGIVVPLALFAYLWLSGFE